MRRPSALLCALPLCLALTSARADVLIRIDKDTQTMAVSVNGQPRFSWPVSTGKAGHDTPNGSYRPQRMARTHFSREWDDAPMPHSIFFTGSGHAIHGSSHLSALGRPASHGCVRLAPGKAAALFRLVKQEGPGNTRIVVQGEAAPRVASRGGVRTARGRNPYESDGVMSAGMQMGRGAYAPAPLRRAPRGYAAPGPYGYGQGDGYGYGYGRSYGYAPAYGGAVYLSDGY